MSNTNKFQIDDISVSAQGHTSVRSKTHQCQTQISFRLRTHKCQIKDTSESAQGQIRVWLKTDQCQIKGIPVQVQRHITPRHWNRRGQHPPAGQSSSSHNLYTENWTLSTPFTSPQTEHFPFRRMSMRHRSSNPQPHRAVLPHLRRFETPDMAQSGGCPQQALGTG